MADDLNLSHAAGQVVAEALQHTRTLFCPFCAVSFLFEFTLKDHLKAEHRDEIAKQLRHQQIRQHRHSEQDSDGDNDNDDDEDVLSRSIQLSQHCCPFCSACFNHLGLIPKHIGSHHGSDLLQLWHQQAGNAERLAAVRQLEPSILYAGCSPGLSVWFQQMMSGSDSGDAAEQDNKTSLSSGTSVAGLKSILKKTPVKPAGPATTTTPRLQIAPFVTIRRSRSDVVKRTLSARRELRFDPSTKHGSQVSPMSAAVAALSPRLMGRGASGVKKTASLKLLRNPFGFVRSKITGTSSTGAENAALGVQQHHSHTNKLITSTPIGLLDDLGAMECPLVRGGGRRTQMDNWKATVRKVTATTTTTTTPLRQRCVGTTTPKAAAQAQAPQQFQCALCKATYAQNGELVLHLRQQHRGLKDWLRPQFSCAGCQTTFYSNRHLLRHCHADRCVAAGRQQVAGAR